MERSPTIRNNERPYREAESKEEPIRDFDPRAPGPEPDEDFGEIKWSR